MSKKRIANSDILGRLEMQDQKIQRTGKWRTKLQN